MPAIAKRNIILNAIFLFALEVLDRIIEFLETVKH